MEPETRYALSGDVSIAYQVVGDGPFDVVFIPSFVSHVELAWTTQPFATIQLRLASFARLIVFDKRDTGMSDRVAGAQTLEARMDDVRAVMDAAGSERAAMIGIGRGVPMSLLFAATYPRRTPALVGFASFARWLWAADYPWGKTEEQDRAQHESFRGIFRSREEAVEAARGFAKFDDEELQLLADYFRRGASPGAIETLHEAIRDTDVRHVLSAIQVPTLLVHGTECDVYPVGAARYMAEQIPGARLLELPDERCLPAGVALDRTMDEVERFLTEVWSSGGWDEPEPDRVLATVLFTDIVGSSERAAELGDRAWQELLVAHDAQVRRQLMRFRGREVNTTGDGFVASFDGPARAIRCAQAIAEGVRQLGIEIRAGLHTGECELVNGKVAGIAVHIGARVADEANPGEVLVSSTVKDLVAGSGISFDDRGVHELKGIPGEWRLFAVDPLSTRVL